MARNPFGLFRSAAAVTGTADAMVALVIAAARSASEDAALDVTPRVPALPEAELAALRLAGSPSDASKVRLDVSSLPLPLLVRRRDRCDRPFRRDDEPPDRGKVRRPPTLSTWVRDAVTAFQIPALYSSSH